MAAALMKGDYAKRVRADFSRAAHNYDAHAGLQRRAAQQLFTLLLPYLALDAHLLDAGCGTGYFSHLLKEKKIGWTVASLDSAEGMCRKAYPAICGDMTALPFKDETFDAVFSSLALQWVSSAQDALAESFRVTKKGGYAGFATLGPETLTELRTAMEQLQIPANVIPFSSAETIAQAAQNAGWRVAACKTSLEHETYPDAASLLRNLKGLGATYKGEAHLKPAELGSLLAHYPAEKDGAVSATFDIILLLLVK